MINLTMFHPNIGQIENPDSPFHQIAPSRGAINQDNRGFGKNDGKGYSGKTDTRPQIPDHLWLKHRRRKEKRICDMSLIDPYCLGRAKTTGG